MGAALEWKAQLGIGTTSPVVSLLSFTDESLKVNQKLENQAGLQGILEEPDDRTVEVERFTDGSFSLNPTPGELDYLIPFILGATKVNDATAMVPTYPLPDMWITVDRHVKVYTYDHCKVASALFSASAGAALKLTVGVMGFDETKGNAGTFPSLTPLEQRPYIMSDLVLLIGGVAYPVNSFELNYENVLERKHFNSILPTRYNLTKRQATWSLDLPAGDAEAINGASASSPVAVQATFTNGGMSFKMRSEVVRAPLSTPNVTGGRGEIPIKWVGFARATQAQPSILKITNDVSA